MSTPQPFMYPRNADDPAARLCFSVLRTGDGFRLNFVSGQFEADPPTAQVYRHLVAPAAKDLAEVLCSKVPPLPSGDAYALTIHPAGGGPALDALPVGPSAPGGGYVPAVAPWALYSPGG